MKHLYAFLIAAAMLFVWAHSVPAASLNPICEKVLPVSEVNKVYGKKIVVLFGTGEAHWANETCNYGHADDKKPVLIVTINPSVSDSLYNNVYKGSPVYTHNRKPISSLGDETFSSGDLNNVIMAKKGKLFVLLVSHSDLDKKTFKTTSKFSTDQLIAWAKQILGRYK